MVLCHLLACRTLNILIEKPVVHSADVSMGVLPADIKVLSENLRNRALKDAAFSKPWDRKTIAHCSNQCYRFDSTIRKKGGLAIWLKFLYGILITLPLRR